MQKKITDFQNMMRAGSGLSYSDYIKSVTPPTLPSARAYQYIGNNSEGDKDFQYEQLANKKSFYDAQDAKFILDNPEWFNPNGNLKTDKMSPMHAADTLWRQGGKIGPSPILQEQRRRNGYFPVNASVPKANASNTLTMSTTQTAPQTQLPPDPTFSVRPWQTLGIQKQGGLFGNKTIFPTTNGQAYLNSAFGAQNQLPVANTIPPTIPAPTNIPANVPQSHSQPHFISNMDRFRTRGNDQNLAAISALVDARIQQMMGRR